MQQKDSDENHSLNGFACSSKRLIASLRSNEGLTTNETKLLKLHEKGPFYVAIEFYQRFHQLKQVIIPFDNNETYYENNNVCCLCVVVYLTMN